MAGIGAADLLQLSRLVDAGALVRGRSYAAGGAVRRCDWDEAGEQVTGEVDGTGPRPYTVAVRIHRTRRAELSSIDGRCSCPVGYNCKHVVALLISCSRPLELVRSAPGPVPAGAPPAVGERSVVDDGAAGAATAAGAPGAPGAPGTPVAGSWEQALRPLVAGAAARADEVADEQGALGLQLELVPSGPAGRRNGLATPGIRVRPVTRSAAGNWVRTGVSWTRLDYLGYAAAPTSRRLRQVEVLRELRALHGLGQPGWSSYGHDAVWLESFGSRRLWDLLRQARELGMAFVPATRDAGPVELSDEPVAVVVDLRADGGGLALRPRLVAAGAEVSLERAVLLGRPAHGVAWWGDGGRDGATAAGPGRGLRLAPLATPVDDQLAGLLRAGAVRIPEAECERFWASLFPALRRRLPVSSSDGSVAVPEPVADQLVLRLDWRGTAVRLSWSLGGDLAGRDVHGEADPVAAAARQAATGACAGTPGLVVPTALGDRLAPTAELEGLVAARFALDVLPVLAAVEGLRVEELGARPAFREVLEAPVVRLSGDETPGGDWLDLAVEVTVGGEQVPFHELFVALAEGAAELLLPSGTLFSLERPELHRLAALIAEARALHDSPRATARLSRFQASLWDDLRQVGATGDEVGAWFDAVAALAAAADAPPVPLPAGLVATLRPYQAEGFQWLATRYAHGLGGILADDMGLGKTLQALALVCHAREQGLATAPFLVVAPTSVVPNWVSEAERFVPGVPVVAVTRTSGARGHDLAAAVEGAGIVVTTYALLRLDHDAYAGIDWAGLFLDEAQFVKNPATQAHRSARRIAAPFKVALTGTPLENSLAELWALTAVTAPGLFPRPDRFAATYRVPIERDRDAARLDQLRRRIRPVLLRRRKEDVASELPDKQEQVIRLDLEPRHRKLYETYLQRERQKILGLLGDLDGNRFEILRSLTLLRQAALSPALVDDRHQAVPSTKLDVLSEMLAEIVEDGHRVLVFSQFTRFLTAARDRATADGMDSCYLDGRTRNRAAEIARFRSGGAPVFFISLKAGGFGLNLAEADYCFLLDPWWNPATEAQAVDRVHRIGQTRKVMVYRLVARQTIEEKVMALKERKAQLFSSVVDDGAFASGTLSVDDVRELLG